MKSSLKGQREPAGRDRSRTKTRPQEDPVAVFPWSKQLARAAPVSAVVLLLLLAIQVWLFVRANSRTLDESAHLTDAIQQRAARGIFYPLFSRLALRWPLRFSSWFWHIG